MDSSELRVKGPRKSLVSPSKPSWMTSTYIMFNSGKTQTRYSLLPFANTIWATARPPRFDGGWQNLTSLSVDPVVMASAQFRISPGESIAQSEWLCSSQLPAYERLMTKSIRAGSALFIEILVSEHVYMRYKAYRRGESNKP